MGQSIVDSQSFINQGKPQHKKKRLEKPELGNPPSVKLDCKTLEKLKCHWMIRENLWKPAVRIGATITTCNNKAYLFGGYNTVSLNDIQFLEPKKA